MKQHKQIAICAAVAALAGGPAGAQQAPPPPVLPAQPLVTPRIGPTPPASSGAPTTAQGLVRYWETRLKAVQAEMARDREALGMATQRQKAGVATQVEVADAQAQLARHQRELDEVSQGRASAVLVAALVRPITVELRDSPVRAAAQVLSDAAGVPVSVDAAVARDLRLTAQAQRVPLASLLEAIGLQAHLMVAPDATGIVLRPWPSLTLGGQSTDFSMPSAPWSPEWGNLMTDWVVRYVGSGSGLQGLRSLGAASPAPPAAIAEPELMQGSAAPLRLLTRPDAAPAPSVGLAPVMPVPPVPAPLAAPSGLVVTPLGGRAFVVAEPGTGPRGEPGTWLTVYQADQQGLHQLGRTFHRRAVGARAPAPVRPPAAPPRRKAAASAVPQPPTPTAESLTPLGQAVDDFNTRAAGDPIGKDQPPLTENEVIAAIEWWQLRRQEAPVTDAEFARFQQVADTRRMPPGAGIEALTAFQPDHQREFTAWSVRLVMPKAAGGTYAYILRERWIASRTFGPHERQAIAQWQERWRRQGGIRSFDRPAYADDLRRARAKDAGTGTSQGDAVWETPRLP